MFHYPARPSLRVLSGLSLTVRPGEIVALVGPSGGGKSSIVKLVERFYLPDEGGWVGGWEGDVEEGPSVMVGYGWHPKEDPADWGSGLELAACDRPGWLSSVQNIAQPAAIDP